MSAFKLSGAIVVIVIGVGLVAALAGGGDQRGNVDSSAVAGHGKNSLSKSQQAEAVTSSGSNSRETAGGAAGARARVSTRPPGASATRPYWTPAPSPASFDEDGVYAWCDDDGLWTLFWRGKAAFDVSAKVTAQQPVVVEASAGSATQLSQSANGQLEVTGSARPVGGIVQFRSADPAPGIDILLNGKRDIKRVFVGPEAQNPQAMPSALQTLGQKETTGDSEQLSMSRPESTPDGANGGGGSVSGSPIHSIESVPASAAPSDTARERPEDPAQPQRSDAPGSQDEQTSDRIATLRVAFANDLAGSDMVLVDEPQVGPVGEMYDAVTLTSVAQDIGRKSSEVCYLRRTYLFLNEDGTNPIPVAEVDLKLARQHDLFTFDTTITFTDELADRFPSSDPLRSSIGRHMAISVPGIADLMATVFADGYVDDAESLALGRQLELATGADRMEWTCDQVFEPGSFGFCACDCWATIDPDFSPQSMTDFIAWYLNACHSTCVLGVVPVCALCIEAGVIACFGPEYLVWVLQIAACMIDDCIWIDHTPPEVTGHNYTTSINTDIRITFSEDMDDTTLVDPIIVVTGSASGRHTCSFSFNHVSYELTIDPAVAFAYGETVTVRVATGATDLAGNFLEEFYQFSFQIEDDPGPGRTSIYITSLSLPSTVDPYETFQVSGYAQYDTGAPVAVGTALISVQGGSTYTAAVSGGSFSRPDVQAPGNSSTSPITRTVSVTVYDGELVSDPEARPLTIRGAGSGPGYEVSWVKHCGDYWEDADGDVHPEDERDYFAPTEPGGLYSILRVYDITTQLRARIRMYKPDGSHWEWTWDSWTDPSWDFAWWAYGWNDIPQLSQAGEYSSRWYIQPSGGSFELAGTRDFVYRYSFTEHKMAEGVQGTSPYDPINPKNIFSPSDAQAYTWMHLEGMSEDISVQWQWNSPEGPDAPYSCDPISTCHVGDPFELPYEWYNVWGNISISGTSRMYKCGDWHVDVKIRDPWGNWQVEYTDHFRIEETTPPSAVTVSASPESPIETQVITLSVSASDNNHLARVVLYWDDGSGHDHTWNTINSGSFNGSHGIGSYVGGQQIEYWAEAWDESGNRAESDHHTITVQAESVTAPDQPSGETSPQVGQSYIYTTRGSTTSLGSPVEYQFDWGDGPESEWGSESDSHAWLADGTYAVKARARSTLNPGRISSCSSALVVSVELGVLELVLDSTSVDVEEGRSASIRVRLSRPPSAETTVHIDKTNGDQDILLLSSPVLTFTTENWDENQDIVLFATDDWDSQEGSASYECSSAEMETVALTATELENDTAALFEVLLDVANADKWFGGDHRVGFTRNVGTGQSVLFPDPVRVTGFQTKLGQRFYPSPTQDLTLVLEVRDPDGSVIDAVSSDLAADFPGGWVSFSCDSICPGQTSRVFTMWLQDGAALETHSGSLGHTSDLLPNSDGYSGKTSSVDGDLSSWQFWRRHSWDFCVRVTGQFVQTGEIAGTKWHDLDGDGQRGAGEPGIEDWIIYIDADEDGSLDEGEISAHTYVNGNYVLGDLLPGDYLVAEQMQDHWEQTYPGHGAPQAHGVHIVEGGSVTAVDFGNRFLAPPVVIDLTVGHTWLYQSLPGQSNSGVTATVAVTDDPMGNTTYSYSWEFVLPADVSDPPVILEGCGPEDTTCRFAAPDCDAAGLSDSGGTHVVRVTVTGNDYGNTGAAEAEFGICLLGDVNHNGIVDVADRSIVNAYWQTGSAGSYTFRDCDVNCNGVVDVADRSIVNAVWQHVICTDRVSTTCPLCGTGE